MKALVGWCQGYWSYELEIGGGSEFGYVSIGLWIQIKIVRISVTPCDTAGNNRGIQYWIHIELRKLEFPFVVPDAFLMGSFVPGPQFGVSTSQGLVCVGG